MHEVAVIDYGVGNLLSVARALEHCGANPVSTSDPATILQACRVVLPGVGAFGDGMAALRARGLVSVLQQVAAAGTPLLGICLGMQMLMDESEEFCVTAGLGLIPGKVVQIPDKGIGGEDHKIPHIGWKELIPSASGEPWTGGLLDEVRRGESVYFVHSFMAEPLSQADRLADCSYDGIKVAAVVRRHNVVGCQFHPEKSGDVGLRIMRAFLQR